MGISREEFIEVHRESLNSTVIADISNDMNQAVIALKNCMEYTSRALSCMILSENRPVRKRTVGEIQTDIERNITYGEQQVEEYLQRLLGSLNVNSTVFTRQPDAPMRPPIIYEQPHSTVYFKRGESVTLPCQAEGNPRPSYVWQKNGNILNEIDGHIVQISGEGTIVIPSPEDKDEGVYQCSADNGFGKSVSIKINLREAKWDQFEMSPPITHHPQQGESLRLDCVPPLSFPPSHFEWALTNSEGRIEPVNYDNRITMDFEGNLYITNVQAEDRERAYACVVVNGFLRRFALDKVHFIRPSGSAPVLRPVEYLWSSPSDNLGLKGETFKLKCIFSGNPTPDVYWTKNNTNLPDRYEVSSGGQELTIPDLTEDDAGTYQCFAVNAVTATRVRRNFVLRVECAKPSWEEEPKDVRTTAGGTATFTCKAKGAPEPKIAWFVNGVKLEESTLPVINSDRFLGPEATSLTFVNLNKDDHMVIQCNASNIHGYVFANAYLEVREGPPFPKFLQDCQESPLIMRIGNDKIDRTEVLTTCSWFLMNKIENGMEKHDEDTVESFVCKFEDFLRGMFAFFQLYGSWKE
uniref:Neuroglian-like n=1 Tax=Crassostrea virginica TaxID=6565 RepID=A0A8B8CE38_CRAVI|nr:neuroglian-like [Crassostrea virginica]